jgi:hypothetical protein
MRSWHLLGLGGLGIAHGAITVLPGGEAKPFKVAGVVYDNNDFFNLSAPNLFADNSAIVLMSNRDDMAYFFNTEFNVLPSSDSFIRGALQAWGEHLHLVISPDAVWLTIMSQLSLYFSAHLDRVKHVFDYEGGDPIVIDYYPDWYAIVFAFFRAVNDRSKAAWFPRWMTPTFSTSTDDEAIAAHAIMMGLTKSSPQPPPRLLCGLPSVTLEGTQADWENMLARLDRLTEFGEEAVQYGERLRPVLSRFVATWKEPSNESTKHFWNSMVTAEPDAQCAGYNMTGWLTAFYYWDTDANPYGRHGGGLAYDGIQYPSLSVISLPVAYARSPFTIMNFNGTERYECYTMGGPIGKRVDPGAPSGYFTALYREGLDNKAYDATKHSSLTPLVTWAVVGPLNHTQNHNFSEWLPDEELGRLNRYIGSNFNQSHCSLSQ